LDTLRPGASDVLPSRETIARWVDKDATEQVLVLKDTITASNAVSITSDMWTDAIYRKYLGASAHIITPEWEIKHFALPLKPTTEKATAANVQKLLLTAMADVGIGPTDPGCITTDRGANMKAAINGTKSQNLGVQALGVPWLPCFSHVIQRALSEMMSSTDRGSANISLAQTEQALLSFTLDLRAAIRSNAVAGILGEELPMPPSPIMTRWMSLYNLFLYVAVHCDSIRSLLLSEDFNTSSELTDTHINVVLDLQHMLQDWLSLCQRVQALDASLGVSALRFRYLYDRDRKRAAKARAPKPNQGSSSKKKGKAKAATSRSGRVLKQSALLSDSNHAELEESDDDDDVRYRVPGLAAEDFPDEFIEDGLIDEAGVDYTRTAYVDISCWGREHFLDLLEQYAPEVLDFSNPAVSRALAFTPCVVADPSLWLEWEKEDIEKLAKELNQVRRSFAMEINFEKEEQLVVAQGVVFSAALENSPIATKLRELDYDSRWTAHSSLEETMNWWKDSGAPYEKLAGPARKALSAQPSSAESERIFSSGGRALTKFRTRMSDKRLANLVQLKMNEPR
jgi:hypothetical protein